MLSNKKNIKRAIILSTSVCSINLVYALGSTNVGTRNDSASCDSTCMAEVQVNSQESKIQQRMIACISGFTGTKLQTRVKLSNGSWGPWTDKDIDNCKCEPTSKTQTKVCDSPFKGTYIEKSSWTCTTPKSGVWSDWFLDTNNCYTPCAPLPAQVQTIDCPSGYGGTQEQRRVSSCSNGETKPPVWGNWETVSSNCQANPTPYIPPSPDCFKTETQTTQYSYWVYTANGSIMRTCTKTEEICYRNHGTSVNAYQSLLSESCN